MSGGEGEAGPAAADAPSLVELCCAQLAHRLIYAPVDAVARLKELSPALRVRIIRQAAVSSHFDEETLQHFGEESLVLDHSLVTDRGLEIVARACGDRLCELGLSRCVRVHDVGLKALLRRCHAIRRLDMSYCRMTDAAIECAARCCPSLTSIDYSWNGSGVGDGAARALAASPAAPGLQSAALCGSCVSDSVLLSLACACPRLATLRVTGCHRLTEPGVVAAFMRLPRLRALDLCQRPHISEASVGLLAAHCAAVERLDLSMCDRVGDGAVANAATGFGRLRRLACYGMLRLHSVRVRSATLLELDLSGCRALAWPVVECPKLVSLAFQNCREVQPATIGAIGAACPALERLDLSGCSKFSKLNLASATLTWLSLSGCTKLASLTLRCAALRTLLLRGCECVHPDDLMAAIGASPHLTELDVTRCAKLRELTLEHGSLTSLTAGRLPAELGALSLTCPALSHLAVRKPAGAALELRAPAEPTLHSVRIDGMHTWRDDEVAALGARTGCALRELALSGPAGTDAPTLLPHARALLGAATHTTSLDLSGCPAINDAMLAEILPLCPRIVALDLSRLRLTRPTIACARLRSLRLCACEALADPTVDCPALCDLDWRGADWLREPTVRSAELTSLSLCGCRSLVALHLETAALERLDISACVALPADAIAATLCGAPALRALLLCGCRRLRSLSLRAAALTEIHLAWCSQLAELSLDCPCLRVLYAYGCLRLANPALACPSLRLLEMQKCKAIDDAAVPKLTHVGSELRLINLTDCQQLHRPTLSSERLLTIHMYNCLSLRAATVACPRLETLNLTYCLAMDELTLRCPRLLTLMCAGCKVLPDDAVLAALQSAPELREFNLTGCAQLRDRTLDAVDAHIARVAQPANGAADAPNGASAPAGAEALGGEPPAGGEAAPTTSAAADAPAAEAADAAGQDGEEATAEAGAAGAALTAGDAPAAAAPAPAHGVAAKQQPTRRESKRKRSTRHSGENSTD